MVLADAGDTNTDRVFSAVMPSGLEVARATMDDDGVWDSKVEDVVCDSPATLDSLMDLGEVVEDGKIAC